MISYVLVPMEDGVVREVQAFLTQAAVSEAERVWLKMQGIDTQKEREHQSDWGAGIAIWGCEAPG